MVVNLSRFTKDVFAGEFFSEQLFFKTSWSAFLDSTSKRNLNQDKYEKNEHFKLKIVE